MSLSEKAMLISLKISQWSGKVQDQKVTQEVANNHGTTADVGRYRKNAVAAEFLKEIKQTANAARTYHYQQTLPWLDDGARILPAANFIEYQGKMGDFERSFEKAVGTFLRLYPEAVETMRMRLNGLFNEADYPEPNVLVTKFGFENKITPIPDAADFRCSISEHEIERIREELSRAAKEAETAAMRDVWERLHSAIERMAVTLPKFDPDKKGKERGTFRDSLVNNIRELCDILPRLNISNDPRLSKMCEDARLLTKHEADTLRDDETVRSAITREAQAMADKMAGFMQ